MPDKKPATISAANIKKLLNEAYRRGYEEGKASKKYPGEWTDADIARLRDAAKQSHSWAEVAMRVGDRSEQACRARSRSLGLALGKPYQRKWTDEETEYLKASYSAGVPMREMIEHLGRPMNSIYHKARILGLAGQGRTENLRGNGRWNVGKRKGDQS